MRLMDPVQILHIKKQDDTRNLHQISNSNKTTFSTTCMQWRDKRAHFQKKVTKNKEIQQTKVMAIHVACCGLLFYFKCYQMKNHLHLFLAIVPSHLTFSMIHNLPFANIVNTTIAVLNGCDICNILRIAISKFFV